jgi:hypothetical protein
MKQRPFWYLLNVYGWVVLAMSVITALIIRQPWIVLLGVIGYQLALLVDLLGGRSLGRTGALRLAQAEQENRELRAEQARLLGAIRERDDRLGQVQAVPEAEEQALPTQESEAGEKEGDKGEEIGDRG